VIQLGTSPPTQPGPVLWTNEHTMEERFSIVRAGDAFRAEGSSEDAAENDLALVAVEVPMHFVVDDVETFERLGTPEAREDILRAVGRRAVMQHLSSKAMGELLGPDRSRVAAELRERIERAYAQLNPGPDGTPRGAGIEILYLGVINPHPPKNAATSFELVNRAQQNYEANIETARADRIETLTRAVGSVELSNTAIGMLDELSSLRTARDGAPLDERLEIDQRVASLSLELEELLVSDGAGEAASLLSEARGGRWESHMTARGRASRYLGQIEAYEANPVVYKSMLYLDMLAEVVRDARLYVLSGEVPSHIRLELQDVSTAQDVFMPEDATQGQ